MSQTQLKAKPRSRTLLVVDDREANLVAMEALLGDGDWQVHTVNSGEAALKALLELDVELVLLDVQMPGMDGFEVARHMQNSDTLNAIPIIMITSRTGDKHRTRALELGVRSYLGKPYQEAELLDNIYTLLAESEQ